jgi:dCTP deaminase
MLLNDKQIASLARQGMITPFTAESINCIESTTTATTGTNKVLSYGLGSFGYDIRLSDKEFVVFQRKPGQIVDPKKFDIDCLVPVELEEDWNGKYFVIPGNSYGLGVAKERLSLPNDISCLCVGKSTYARAGIIANITPAEAGWKEHLTLEFSNSSPADCRVYANEGIVQLLFLQGDPCRNPYYLRSNGGKYQNQDESITYSKV